MQKRSRAFWSTRRCTVRTEKAAAAARRFRSKRSCRIWFGFTSAFYRVKIDPVKRWDDLGRLRAVGGERSAFQDHSAAYDDGMSVAERELRAGMR